MVQFFCATVQLADGWHVSAVE